MRAWDTSDEVGRADNQSENSESIRLNGSRVVEGDPEAGRVVMENMMSRLLFDGGPTAA